MGVDFLLKIFLLGTVEGWHLVDFRTTQKQQLNDVGAFSFRVLYSLPAQSFANPPYCRASSEL